MTTSIRAYAAPTPGAPLEPFSFDPGEIGPEEVEIKVTHCGICHSHLSMLDNEWGMTKYPFVPGHEAVGTVRAVGSLVTSVKPGDCVGLGWYSRSCMRCRQCMGGDHNLCPTAEATIIGRHGAFANTARCHWA